jgi:hypothetical protein
MSGIEGARQNSLRYRLITHTREHWPQLAGLTIRHRGQFAYIDGELPDGGTPPLFRLRYGASGNSLGFAVHLASRDAYEDAALLCGCPGRHSSKEHSIAPAASYLNDPTAWAPDELTDVTHSLLATTGRL